MRNSSEILQLLGARLRTERSMRRLTQQELAERAGVSHVTVSNIESGRSVGMDYFIRVAMVLDRSEELENLFQPNLPTVEAAIEHGLATERRRIRKKGKPGG